MTRKRQLNCLLITRKNAVDSINEVPNTYNVMHCACCIEKCITSSYTSSSAPFHLLSLSLFLSLSLSLAPTSGTWEHIEMSEQAARSGQVNAAARGGRWLPAPARTCTEQ